MAYYSLRLCSGGGAFEAIPSPRRSLDLPGIRARLEAGHVPVVDARVMLIVQLEREVTVSRDGRLLFKTRDAAEADRLYRRLQPLLELPDLAPAAS